MSRAIAARYPKPGTIFHPRPQAVHSGDFIRHIHYDMQISFIVSKTLPGLKARILASGSCHNGLLSSGTMPGNIRPVFPLDDAASQKAPTHDRWVPLRSAIIC